MNISPNNPISIIQLGCGGTGSWLVNPLSRFIMNLRNRFGEHIYYHLIDDDVIEPINLIRQNFPPYDCYNKKAISLAKICASNGLTVRFHINKLTSKKQIKMFINDNIPSVQTGLMIFIGCVDCIKTRKTLYNYLLTESNSCIYIDSGNELYHGQIITSVFNLDRLDYKFNNEQYFCNPDFLKIYKANNKTTAHSCAFFGDQSQATNLLASTLIFNNIQQMFINNTLPPNIINFNSSGYCTFNI